MEALLVMTIIGRDRPGLVDSVAQVVAAHGGNWLESRMSRLGGHFAGILRVSVPSDRQPALGNALRQLQSAGLSVVVHRDEAMAEVPNARRTVRAPPSAGSARGWRPSSASGWRRCVRN